MDRPYLTAEEAAAKLGVSPIRIRQLCQSGQIEGAAKFGRAWLIPVDKNGDVRRRWLKRGPPFKSTKQ